MPNALWAVSRNGEPVLDRLYSEDWRAMAAAAMDGLARAEAVEVRVLRADEIDVPTAEACARFIEADHPAAAAAIRDRLSSFAHGGREGVPAPRSGAVR